MNYNPSNTPSQFIADVNSLVIDGANSSLDFDGTATSSANISLADSDATLTITTPALSISKQNSNLSLTNVNSDLVSLDLTNNNLTITESVLEKGNITLVNSPATLTNVISDVDFKLTNSDLKANQLKLIEKSSTSIKAVNSLVKLKALRCIAKDSTLANSAYITKLSANIYKNINKTTGKIQLLKQVTVRNRKQYLQCANVILRLTNGKLIYN